MKLRRVIFGTRIRAGCWLAMIGWLLGSAGPGAVLAGVRLLDDGHAHQIAFERDAGHADLVLCHDTAAAIGSDLPELRTRNCDDDHRLHVANAADLAVRADARVAAALAVATPSAVPLAPAPVVALRDAGTGFDPALDAARRRHRTIVLRV